MNGHPALGVEQIDRDAFEFRLNPLANIEDGTYLVEVSADAILDSNGNGNHAFQMRFQVDTIAPRIISSSISMHQKFTSSDLDLVFQFDERLRKDTLSESSFRLNGALSGKQKPSDILYDAQNSTLTLRFADLPDDQYVIELLSDGGISDLVGNSLDGEYRPLGEGPSGDGEPGGKFALSFVVDNPAPLAVSLISWRRSLWGVRSTKLLLWAVLVRKMNSTSSSLNSLPGRSLPLWQSLKILSS